MAKVQTQTNHVVNGMKFNNVDVNDEHQESFDSDDDWRHDEKLQEELENLRELIQGKFFFVYFDNGFRIRISTIALVKVINIS